MLNPPPFVDSIGNDSSPIESASALFVVRIAVPSFALLLLLVLLPPVPFFVSFFGGCCCDVAVVLAVSFADTPALHELLIFAFGFVVVVPAGPKGSATCCSFV